MEMDRATGSAISVPAEMVLMLMAVEVAASDSKVALRNFIFAMSNFFAVGIKE